MANICRKCNGEISDVDLIFCPNCGKAYHKWCRDSMPNCVECGVFNENYAAQIVNRAAKISVEQDDNNCAYCNSAVSPIDAVKCPDCGKIYHRHCSLKIQGCSSCGCASVRFVKTNDVPFVPHTTQDIGMFSNIGEKIKSLAMVVTVVGIIIGVIVFIINAATDEDLIFTGLLAGVSIGLCSWIGSFALYGFGALISSTQNIERFLSELIKQNKK